MIKLYMILHLQDIYKRMYTILSVATLVENK